MCTQVLICSTEFAPPTKVNLFAPGCIFIKHRLYDQNTPQVQNYTPGVYLHRGVYCAYKRGFRLYNFNLEETGVYSAMNLARAYKTFFMLNSTEHEISTNHKNYNTDKSRSFFLKFLMLYLSYL